MAEQLPFDLGHRQAFSRDDFWVSSCNAQAIAWLDRWPQWPSPLLVIQGPAGCGKSHLCHVFEQMTKGKADIIDDADRQMGDAVFEEKLFHLYNRFTESSRHILMTGNLPPRNWPILLPDLKSRILSAPIVQVGAPDDQLMAVVLSKHFSDRQIFVPQEVIAFILSRIERSFAALRAVAQDIDRKAMTEKRAITLPLVRDVLQKKFV